MDYAERLTIGVAIFVVLVIVVWYAGHPCLRTERRWHPGSTTFVSVGQGVTVPVVQLAGYVDACVERR